jgi:hypothetical protein
MNVKPEIYSFGTDLPTLQHLYLAFLADVHLLRRKFLKIGKMSLKPGR